MRRFTTFLCGLLEVCTPFSFMSLPKTCIFQHLSLNSAFSLVHIGCQRMNLPLFHMRTKWKRRKKIRVKVNRWECCNFKGDVNFHVQLRTKIELIMGWARARGGCDFLCTKSTTWTYSYIQNIIMLNTYIPHHNTTYRYTYISSHLIRTSAVFLFLSFLQLAILTQIPDTVPVVSFE